MSLLPLFTDSLSLMNVLFRTPDGRLFKYMSREFVDAFEGLPDVLMCHKNLFKLSRVFYTECPSMTLHFASGPIEYPDGYLLQVPEGRLGILSGGYILRVPEDNPITLAVLANGKFG